MGARHWPNLTKNDGFATGFLRFGNAAAGAIPPFFALLTHQSALKKIARSVGRVLTEMIRILFVQPTAR
jgi:hypothetical protein